MCGAFRAFVLLDSRSSSAAGIGTAPASSSGTTLPRVPRALESRLTYDNLRGNSGEFFGRVDTPFDVYVKGNVGGGNIIGGQMNDEDWGIVTQGGAIAYTNTISHEKDGDLRYGTIDIGYDLWRTRAVKVGPFVGYNLYREKANSFGCVQIANPAFPCLAPGDSTLIGNQENEWKSVRVGTSAEIKIAPNVKLTGDAAYLPHVSFDGRDNHLLRNPPVFFDQDGDGRGVQLEAILSVDVTPRFSLGVGGRYWSMWTTDAAFTCTGCTAPGVTSSPPNPSRNSTERFGLLLQGSYKFAEDEPRLSNRQVYPPVSTSSGKAKSGSSSPTCSAASSNAQTIAT